MQVEGRTKLAGPGERLVCMNCRTTVSENSSYCSEGDEVWCQTCTKYVSVRIVPANGPPEAPVELSNEERNMAALAQSIVADVMAKNTQHRPNAWLRPQWADRHLQKAVRHIMSAQLIRDGHELDQEGVETHLRHALTRIAMAIMCQPVHCPRSAS